MKEGGNRRLLYLNINLANSILIMSVSISVLSDSPESTNTQNTDIREFQTTSRADRSGTENDIGKWPDHLTISVLEYWIKKGPKDLRNRNAKLIEQKSIFKNVKISLAIVRLACLNGAHSLARTTFERHTIKRTR